MRGSGSVDSKIMVREVVLDIGFREDRVEAVCNVKMGEGFFVCKEE